MTTCDFGINDSSSAQLAGGGSRSLTLSSHFEVAVMMRLHCGVIKGDLWCFISTDPPICPHVFTLTYSPGREHGQMSELISTQTILREDCFLLLGLCWMFMFQILSYSVKHSLCFITGRSYVMIFVSRVKQITMSL